MRLYITHKETGCGDGFKARGTSLYYHYDPELMSLDIHRPKKNKESLLHRINTEVLGVNNPIEFAGTTEKASQIFALTYSDHTSINLCEAVHKAKLTPIVGTVVATAKLACDLTNDRLIPVTDFFLNNYDIGAMNLEKIENSRSDDYAFYRSRLESIHGNSITVCAQTLHTLMLNMSERVLRDIVVLEYGNHKRESAQTLLQISARLASLSRILDKSFRPSVQIRTEATEFDKANYQ